jgi:gentisate 1,2-dioxygenase
LTKNQFYVISVIMTNLVTVEKSQHDQSEMDRFREGLTTNSLAPLWDMMRRLAPLAPDKSGGTPIHWTWRLLRERVLEAGALITAEEAERRVLVLENPAFAGEGRATTSLYAGVQLLLPGETAPSHRHTASAIRLIMEGHCAFTAVDGERVMMSPGDFIVTPSGTFHDHGNDGGDPVMWLDGLDVFVVNLLNAAFGEDHPSHRQPVERKEGNSDARFAAGLLPADHSAGTGRSTFFHWPYHRTIAALKASVEIGRVDPALGAATVFVDPATGVSPVRTMTARMSLYPRGFRGERHRAVSGSVLSVVEGTGRVTVGDKTWQVGPRDVFIVPSWQWSSFETDDDLVVFGFSDEALQRHLGFWREERA